MIQSSDNVSAYLMVEDSLKVDGGVWKGCPNFENNFIFEKWNTGPRQTLKLELELNIILKAYFI